LPDDEAAGVEQLKGHERDPPGNQHWHRIERAGLGQHVFHLGAVWIEPFAHVLDFDPGPPRRAMPEQEVEALPPGDFPLTHAGGRFFLLVGLAIVMDLQV
jgi:hypothetical protein